MFLDKFVGIFTVTELIRITSDHLFNRPTGGIALTLLAATLHFNPTSQEKTFREHVVEFDFPGLILLVGGVVCVLLGFNASETSCTFTFSVSCTPVIRTYSTLT